VGDIVDTIYYALVVIDHNVFVRSATRERMVLNDVGNIERIWRANSEGEYEVIWRADNAN
jgi:outer membrane protein assembly factor BamB